jgi:hypothetical protein
VSDERVYLTVAEVVAIHHHQIEEYGGEHGLLNQLWNPQFFGRKPDITTT